MPPEQALVTFVRKIAVSPERTVPPDIDALCEAGWGLEEIIESIVMAMFAGFTNTLTSALHLEDDTWDLIST